MRRNLSHSPISFLFVAALWGIAAPAAFAQATITVNSTAQEVTVATPNGVANGNCTLGEALLAANNNAAVDACTAGQSGGQDTIVVPAGTYTFTTAGRTLAGFANKPIAIPDVTGDVIFQGAGAATTILERSTAAGTPAIGLTHSGNSVTFNQLTIRNFATPCNVNGGAVMFFTGPVTLNDSIVEGNVSDGFCGGGMAIFAERFNSAAPFTATNTLFRNNAAVFGNGAVIYSTGPVTLTNSTFLTNNNISGPSGVLLMEGDGPLNITGGFFSGNTGTGSGAVIRLGPLANCGPACGVNPVVNITRSYFLNNSTPVNGSSGSSGGVLSTSGQNLTMTITESTFSDNVAGSNIGGVFNFEGNTGTVTIENSTFSGNRAATFGTAIYARGNAPGIALTLNNVTITENAGTAFPDGAALFLDFNATATLRNTVIARNTVGGLCDVRTLNGGNFISQGNNMFGHTACAVFSVTDPSDQMWSQQWPFHPVLIPLADNGGPQAGANIGGATPVTIPTRGLFTGSPLINLGNAAAPGSGGTACLATDQRGQARPGGARCDIGAFEDATAAGVIAVFDLAVTKTDTPDPVNVGQDITYTITVTNTGTDPAPNVVVTDPLPVGVTFVSAIVQNDPFGTCAFAAGTVTCNIGTVAQGDSLFVTLVVNVTASVSSPVVNTATATATGTEANNADNSGTASTVVNGVGADLSLTKTDAPDPIILGAGNITYTLTIGNAGPQNATNVVLTDTLPGNASFVSSSSSQGTCAPPAAGTLTCNLGAINNGASATVTIIVTPTAAGTVNNTASVAATESDPTPANNTASTSTTVNAVADLSVTKTDAPDPLNLGAGNITYTVTVANAGPSPATATVLTDTLPAGVNFVSATAPCTQAAGTVTCNLGTLASGANTVVTIVITPTAAGSLNNTASVTSGVTDPTPANNTASATTTVNPSADVSVAVADAPDPVVAGANVTYTVTVSNAGPSPATAVVVTNTLPAGVTLASSTPSAGTCGAPAAGVFTCNLGGITSGANATVAVVVTTSGATAASINNSATATAAEFDPNAANNTASAATTVTPSANLSLTLADAPDPATVGGNITYTATIANAGPSNATTVAFTMAVPANTTFVSAIASAGTCTQTAGTITCNIGTVNNGASVTVTAVVLTTAAATVNASASVTSAVSDPAAANNSSAAATTVNASTGTGYTVSSSTPSQTIFASQSANFNVAVTPTGGSYTNPVALTATGLPAGATFSFNPASVTPGAAAANSVLTISVPFRAMAPPPSAPFSRLRIPMWFIAMLSFTLALLGIAATLRRAGWQAARTLRTAALVLLVILLTGGTMACATSDGGFPLTNQSGTYNITITGTSGAIQQSTSVTLTVQ